MSTALPEPPPEDPNDLPEVHLHIHTSMSAAGFVVSKATRRRPKARFRLLVATIALTVGASVYTVVGIWGPNFSEWQQLTMALVAGGTNVLYGQYLIVTNDGRSEEAAARSLDALRKWFGSLATLGGTALFALPALLFPPRRRKDWLHDVWEAFDLRQQYEASFWWILGSNIGSFPVALSQGWGDYLGGRPDPVLALDGHDGHPAGKRPGWFRRHASEIGWAAVFGLVLLVICEIGKAYLHSRGLVYPWDAWFPAAEH